MNRIHSTLIAVLIGAAATAGLYAAVNTVRLGQRAPAQSVSARDIASRQAKLVAWRHSLDAAHAKRPPALPKLPHYAPVSASAAPPSAATAQAHVIYAQAPTVVKYEHAPPSAATTTTSSWSDDESGDDDPGEDPGDDPGGDDD